MTKLLNNNISLKFLSILVVLLVFNCNDDDNIIPKIEEPISITDNIEVINEDLMQPGFVLAVESSNDSSFLIDKNGNKVKEWSFDSDLGNDLELLENGNLLGIFKVPNPSFTFGGYGGEIKIIDNNSQTIYNYIYANDDVLAHHDVEQLPNGNLLFVAWEKVDNVVAVDNGFESTQDIYPETLVEVNPTTNQIVWKWNSMDHIIQDHDTIKLNFGNVNNNPQLVDINYNSDITNGDIMHINGIDYDSTKDLVYLSVNFYSEIWVIDHSTTTSEAATNSGGNYNKGGDLLYRFGNPETYNNTVATRLFYNNHFPNLIEGDKPGAGNILVYMNGNNNAQSIVYEFAIPESLELVGNQNNEPQIVWSFTDSELYFARLSGATRLRNGNTLICEADYGFWEVTNDGTVVWKYSGLDESAFWRGYDYYADDQAIINLGL